MSRPAQAVTLSVSDQSALRAIVGKGTHKSRKIRRANALLVMGAGGNAAAVEAQTGVSSTQYYK